MNLSSYRMPGWGLSWSSGEGPIRWPQPFTDTTPSPCNPCSCFLAWISEARSQMFVMGLRVQARQVSLSPA